MALEVQNLYIFWKEHPIVLKLKKIKKIWPYF